MNRFKQFYRWMKGNVFLFVIAVVLLFVLNYIRTLVPLFMQHVVDNVLGDKASKLPDYLSKFTEGNTIKERLFLTVMVLLTIVLIRVSIMFIRRAVNALFSERIAYNMRNTLYRQLQDLSFTYHSHAETGDLIQRCTTDVETYRVFISEQLIEVLRLVFLMSFSIYQMVHLNVKMTYISLISAPIIFISAYVYFLYVKKVFKRVEESEGKMTTTLQENITGIRVVKAFAREEYELEKFEKNSRKYSNENTNLINLMAMFWGGTDLIIFIQYCLTASFGVYFAVNGHLTQGEYISFLGYVSFIVWPMRQLGRIVGDFGKTTVALDRLDGIMNQETEYEDYELLKPEIKGEVEFDNVTFQFEDDERPLLKNISFKAKRGETIAIVGKTGSGKSTLMNLMVRLLDYNEGSIKFDGTSIKEIDKHWIRKHIGIILQEPFLFSKTVYDNIGILNKKANKETIYNAATIASLHEDITNFEKGYDTLVGERGVTLSGGQKQRVAIARMLLEDRPVLIFDDSLSAVDTETDLQIRKALKTHWENTTVFIITHRITTALEADRVIVLDKGKMSQMGTHDELVKEEGIYKNLWDIQTKIEFDFDNGKKGGE